MCSVVLGQPASLSKGACLYMVADWLSSSVSQRVARGQMSHGLGMGARYLELADHCVKSENPPTLRVPLLNRQHSCCTFRQCVEEQLGASCPVCDTPAHARDAQVNRQLSNIVSLSLELGRLLQTQSQMNGKGKHPHHLGCPGEQTAVKHCIPVLGTGSFAADTVVNEW